MNRYQLSIDYLKSKARGGASNQRGNKYEQYFAVFLLAQLSNRNEPTRWGDILLSTQVFEFVDDLMVKEIDRFRFFQLKSGQTISWGGNVVGSLFYDFLNQKRRSALHRTAFSLHLVVPTLKQRNKLAARIPKPIRRWTQIDYFPSHQSLDLLVNESAAFRAEMAKLCAIFDPPRVLLASISKSLLGAWIGTNQRDISLVEILDQVYQISGTFLRPHRLQPIQEATKSVLDTISGFSYSIENGYLTWKFGATDEGKIPYVIGSLKMNMIEDQIQSVRPTTFEALETIII